MRQALVAREQREATVDVLEENVTALHVFLDCATQWRHAGMAAARTGLDYTAVLALMQAEGEIDVSDTFWRVRALERGALEQWAKQHNQ